MVAFDTAAHRPQTNFTVLWKVSSTDDTAIGQAWHFGHLGKKGLLSMWLRSDNANCCWVKNLGPTAMFLANPTDHSILSVCKSVKSKLTWGVASLVALSAAKQSNNRPTGSH